MKILTGTVISNKMPKTVVIEVERLVKHPFYQKYMRRSKKYKAHNPNLTLNIGDQVSIKPVRPISKDKHYQVVAKL